MATSGPSITSTESFLARAQRSEERRVWLWLCVLVGMVLVTVGRRAAHGVVMSANETFFPTLGVLIASIAFQVVLLLDAPAGQSRDDAAAGVALARQCRAST